MTQEKRKALGRGLESLIPAARATNGTAAATAAAPIPTGEAVREIPVEQIARNPYQTRVHVDEAALEELAASIAATGVLQPIVVRPIIVSRDASEVPAADNHLYQLIAGERRWLASQRAGKKTVPAIVRQVSNEQAMEMTIVENLQREDLNPMEQAHAFDRLGHEFHLTQEEMSQRTGKTRSSIANYLRLLKLPAKVQEALTHDYISFGHAKVLMALDAPENVVRALNRVLRDSLSVRQTEQLVEEMLRPAEGKAPPAERQLDPNVRAAERALQEALGVKVQIKDRNGRGRIVIEYASLDDFDRVLEMLGKS